MTPTDRHSHELRLRRLGIDTYQEHVILMRSDCHVCQSEGFQAQTRVNVGINGRQTIATLNVITTDLLSPGEAALSESAWAYLDAQEGQMLNVSHPDPVASLGYVRGKVYGNGLTQHQLEMIIDDIVAKRYTDVELAAFLTACAQSLSDDEVVWLTRAMIGAGQQLSWPEPVVVDKHCVGGLPGNRTTMIVVPILVAAGLTVPKTSSRAITSPAGTADVMETVSSVDLSIDTIRKVVDKVGGCIAWGGNVRLSPADDILVRVERALDIDSTGQLVASVLSKKVAAGSTHVVVDIPVGPTAKVRDAVAGAELARLINLVGAAVGLKIRVIQSDGSQPVGCGIGPALEASDVLRVLNGEAESLLDLRSRSVEVAGGALELAGLAAPSSGARMATELLDSGAATEKFVEICEAQGGFRQPPQASFRKPVLAERTGRVVAVDNRRIAKVAKLAGAPNAAAAGMNFFAFIGREFTVGEPIFVIHSESEGELDYAHAYVQDNPNIVTLEDI